MRSWHTGSVAAAFALIALSPLATHNGVAEAQVAQRVDRLLPDCYRPGAPGAAVVIMQHGQVIYQRQCGLANLEHDIPVARDTRFELASVSKQFTAFAVFLLEHEGMLSLNDPIREYLPELPDYADPIRIHHLVHHTSGLPEYLTVARLAGFGEMDVIAFDDLLRMLQRWESLYRAPGSEWDYTNTNYALLAEIVARVTGEAFPDWMAANVFAPLRMHDSFIRSSARQVITAGAEGYRERDGGFVLAREALGAFPGHARAYSTIDDMVRWLENFRSMTVGGADVMRRMVQRGTLQDGSEIDYAGGLYVWRYHGVTALSHSGVGGGFRTNVTYSPDADVGIVVLSNGGSIEPTQLGLRLLDWCLGNEAGAASAAAPGPDDQVPVELAPAAYAGFPGRYVIEGVGIAAAIWRDGDQWMGAMEGLGAAPLYVVSETELASDDDSVRIAFVAGEAGPADRVRLRVATGEQEVWATRVGATTEPSDRDYAGQYYSAELGAVYELEATEAGLVLRHRRMGDVPLHLMTADRLAGEIGILRVHRGDEGGVQGFTLHHELLPDRGVRFEKLRDSAVRRRQAPATVRSGRPASEQAPTAEEVIARSIEARGGLAALRARQSVKMVARVERPQDGFGYSMTLFRKRPTFYRSVLEMGDTTIIRATDGESAWMVSTLAGSLEPAAMPADQAATFNRQAHIDTSL